MAGGLLAVALASVGTEVGTYKNGLTPGITPEICAYEDFGAELRACLHPKFQGLNFDEIDLGVTIGARAPIADGPWFVGGNFSYDSAVTGPRAEGELALRPTLAIEAGLNPKDSPLNLVGGVYGGFVSIADRFPGGSETVASQGHVGVFVGLEGQIPLWGKKE